MGFKMSKKLKRFWVVYKYLTGGGIVQFLAFDPDDAVGRFGAVSNYKVLLCTSNGAKAWWFFSKKRREGVL